MQMFAYKEVIKLQDRQRTFNVTLRRVRTTIVVNGKAISITNYESVFVTLAIQYAMRMRYTVICGFFQHAMRMRHIVICGFFDHLMRMRRIVICGFFQHTKRMRHIVICGKFDSTILLHIIS
jgi:hypothetical protein